MKTLSGCPLIRWQNCFKETEVLVGKHIRNIFKEGELQKEPVWAKFAYTATDGKVYDVDFYNLDVIISVGYRVKSKHGTQFRIWTMGQLVSGYLDFAEC